MTAITDQKSHLSHGCVDIGRERLHRELEKAYSILLTVHVSPDGDAIGSLLAMYEALTAKGKAVTMVIDDKVPHKYTFLPLVRQIKTADEVFGKTGQSDTSAAWDLMVILDASTFERIGLVGRAAAAIPTVNIDHHISNSRFAKMLYLKADFAATGEILTDLFLAWHWEITPSMAEALYLAIGTDCGFFRYSNTTAHTLEMGAECVRRGAHPNIISEAVEAVSLKRLEITQKALQTISFAAEGQIGFIALDRELMAEAADDTDGYVDLVRQVDTVDVAVLLKAVDHQHTRVSLRSKRTDVNAVAAVFGGGGHIRAAGCTIDKPLVKARAELCRVLEAALAGEAL